MTYEEALRELNSLIKCAEYAQMDYQDGVDVVLLAICKEALEKQVPKKPIKANRAIEIGGQLFMKDENEYWKCPICVNYDVPLRENQQYCHYCGQKIDWGEEE